MGGTMDLPFIGRKVLLLLVIIISVFANVSSHIDVSTRDLSIQINHKDNFVIRIRNYVVNNKELQLEVQHTDIITIQNSTTIPLDKENDDLLIEVKAVGAGHSEITAKTTDPKISVKDVYLRVTVNKIPELITFSEVIGWIYFVAWSISFYPQVYINYKRKSVKGLNFDFLALNVLGFTLYAIFNAGLYFIDVVKEEYSDRYPRGLNPVQVNDIVFAIHATLATILTIVQCFIYERSDQRISITARVILGIFGVFIFISVILGGTGVIHWLDFLYYCSYVKLTITLIKYVPQAYMNYKRKSTVGWSIGNIFFDFTGGILSMLQMIVNSYNYDDWVSIFGDPTKFGLGLFSVIFDILFIIQHYILYRHTNYEES